jgi:DNA-binding XRE family transcriptional regulator
MSPEARARAQEKARKDMAEMALDEVREARAMTQEHLAKILGIRQSAVSKMERRADMYVSIFPAWAAVFAINMATSLNSRPRFDNPDVMENREA